MTRLWNRVLVLLAVGPIAACSTSEGDGHVARASFEASCTHPGVPGDSQYCREDCPCDEGLGDCDSDAECLPGLVCRRDVGDEFGWPSEVDVCLSPCEPIGRPVSSMCTTECPCVPGHGDCDADSDCAGAGWCLFDAGTSYGYPDPETDICVVGCPTVGAGAGNFCSSTCPCDAGGGDCDSDADCASGLACANNVGALYGFDPDVDVCQSGPGACVDDALEDNDSAPSATPLVFDSIHNGMYADATVYQFPVRKCGGDEDWYLVPSSQLSFGPDLQLMAIRGTVKDAGICGPQCGETELPPVPANTIRVRVYDASTMTLLDDFTRDEGRIVYNRFGNLAAYANDILLRVTGPAVAEYDYTIGIRLANDLFEDECEC